MSWSDDQHCGFIDSHAPHLWGDEIESVSGSMRYISQVVFRCDGAGRWNPDE